jgi:hypothetical protein
LGLLRTPSFWGKALPPHISSSFQQILVSLSLIRNWRIFCVSFAFSIRSEPLETGVVQAGVKLWVTEFKLIGRMPAFHQTNPTIKAVGFSGGKL